MTLAELLKEESVIAEDGEKKERIKHMDMNRPADEKPGRTRLIDSIVSYCREHGVRVSYSEARSYVNNEYPKWANRQKSYVKLSNNAKTRGFDPYKYKDQKPGDSAGKGKKEYKGRAYYFNTFRKIALNHFIGSGKSGAKDKYGKDITFKKNVMDIIGGNKTRKIKAKGAGNGRKLSVNGSRTARKALAKL